MQRGIGALLLTLAAVSASVHLAAPRAGAGARAGARRDLDDVGGVPGLHLPGATPSACDCDGYPERLFLEDAGTDADPGLLGRLTGPDAVERSEGFALLYAPRGGAATEARSPIACVLATVTDPLESQLDFSFDQSLIAVQAAARAEGYHLERFWVPWLRSRSVDACFDECRRRPGVLLLSRPGVDGAGRGHETLAVILSGETPTGGVDRVGLERAIGLAEAMPGHCRGEDGRVPVLGPTFSGSTASLARTLRRHGEERFRVLSGSATSPGNSAYFDGPDGGDAPGARITFAATVVPDDVALRQFASFVRGTLQLGPGDVALLVEGNTTYGKALRQKAQADALADWVLPFPLHISALRGEYEKEQSAEQAAVPGSGIPRPDLGLLPDSSAQARDTLPQFAPISVNYGEQVLADLLATIARHRIKLVGIFATDTRDKLFLAEQVRAHSPDAQIFTLGADVLLAYPDEQRALYGALVVSSYPLFTDTLAWVPPFGDVNVRSQFGAEAYQGMYNAMLFLLRRDERLEYGADLPYLDYQCPFSYLRGGGFAGRPPVWVSAVGKNGLWPLSVACDYDDRDYVRVGAVNPGNPRRVQRLWLSRSEQLWLLALGLFTVWQGLAFWKARRDPESGGWASWTSELYRVPRLRAVPWGRTLLVAQLGLLAAAVASGLALWVVEGAFVAAGAHAAGNVSTWGVARQAFLAQDLAAWTALGPLAAAMLMLMTTWALRGRATPASTKRAERRSARRGDAVHLAEATALVALTLVLSVAALPRYLRASWLLLFYRVVNPASGLSPLLPFLLLGAGMYVLVRLALRRRRLLDCHLPAEGPSAPPGMAGAAGERRVLSQFVPGLPAGEQMDRELLWSMGDAASAPGQLWPRARRWAVPAVAVVLLAVILFVNGVRSLEPGLFTALFVVGFCGLALAVLLTMLRGWTIWRALRGLLEAISTHPVERSLSRLRTDLPRGFARRFLLTHPTLLDLQALVTLHRRWVAARGQGEEVASVGATYERELQALSRARIDPFPWRSDTYGALLAEVGRATVAAAEEGGSASARRAAGDFLAAHVAMVVAWVLSHLRIATASMVAGALFLLTAPSVYPFQPKRLFTIVTWPLFFGVVALALGIYAQIERDTVVSRVTGTDPGRLNLGSGFLLHAFTLGVVPVIVFLVVEFPVLNQWAGAWLDPVLRMIR